MRTLLDLLREKVTEVARRLRALSLRIAGRTARIRAPDASNAATPAAPAARGYTRWAGQATRWRARSGSDAVACRQRGSGTRGKYFLGAAGRGFAPRATRRTWHGRRER